MTQENKPVNARLLLAIGFGAIALLVGGIGVWSVATNRGPAGLVAPSA